jgi:hypothetical protein
MVAMSNLGAAAYVGKYFAITFDGFDDVGFLKSVEGGNMKAELITQQVGGQPYRVKHIQNPVIDPVTVSIPLAASKSFLEWVKKSWAGECERRSGAIITYDYDHNAVHEWSFTEALILETSIPAMDGNSKDAGFLTVKFQAETAEHKFNPGGERLQLKNPAGQSKWQPANFLFEIDGLDVQRVAKIDGFTVKQNAKPMACGSDWLYQIEPTSLEFPNLTVYVTMVAAQPFFDWHQSFLVNGKNGPGEEKTGAITFYDPTLTEVLLTINLKAMGLVSITPEKSDASGQDQIKRAKIELYCEEMEFVYPG